MTVYDEKTDFKFNKSAVTLGKFDGLHLGHQELIGEVVNESRENGYESVLFSFDTSRISSQPSITTRDERCYLVEKYGIDNVIFYPVNRDTMSMEPETFIREILYKKLGAKLIVTGIDFRFGKDRKGDIETLKKYSEEYGYEVRVKDNVMVDGEKVSSTAIKKYILDGNVSQAGKMLGLDFFYMGEIVKGNQIGRTIDSRTANLIPAEEKIIPKYGVYKSETVIDGVGYKSITNIGLSPTIRSESYVTVETHILNFDHNVYGKGIVVKLKNFIREERKFANIDELKRQILLDISQANL